ncbi:MAG: YiiX/YebB-like N1pC/P60 family cysteine hydrolase [Planctomycetales bacterium]
MSWILVAALMTGSPEPVSLQLAEPDAAESLAADLPTGSLIFSKGDCLAVKVLSASPYTHVGTVVQRGGRHEVYDSTGGTGVRKLSLSAYLASQGDADLYVFTPDKPWTREQRERFERHLESQLGRPYAITHHFSGERCEGLHCAEYATDALIAGNVLQARKPPRVSPASLRQGIEQSELYRQRATVHLTPEAPSPPADAGRCGRWWFSTKECTRTCYRKLKGWFCCK